MKKSFILLAAALAFAACAKNEVSVGEKAIEFAPNALLTKALILPGSDSSEQLAFPTGESFNVFGFAALDGVTYDYSSPLMNDVNISYQGGDWKATGGVYLWPATGKVDFYAYYPGSLSAEFVSSEPRGVKLTDVSLGTQIGNQIDPLVAATVAQRADEKPTVSLVFKHISSQFAVKVQDVTEIASLKDKITLTGVTLKNFRTSGTYTEGSSVGKGSWSGLGTTADFSVFSGSLAVSTDEKYLSAAGLVDEVSNESAFVVVPDGIAADLQVIEVKYRTGAYTLNGFDYPASGEKTVVIPLYGRVSGNTLLCGKRYVIHLGISLDGANDEILFSPAVEGWQTEDISGITIDAFKASLM